MTFKRLSEYFQKLEETSSRLKITEILAALFKETDVEEIDKICYLSLGRLLPAYEGLEFQMAEKMVIRAIAKAFGINPEEVQREYKRVGDLGEVGEEFKIKSQELKVQNKLWDTGSPLSSESRDSRGKELGVLKVYERLMEIAREAGAGSVERKVDKLAVLIEDLDATSVHFIVRIPLGKLRLGFSDMTILDALSWMGKGDKSLRTRLEDVYDVVADIGEIAKKVKESGLQGIARIKPKVGTPILPALAQRIGTVEEMLEKMGTVAMEPKYDGTRLQLHKGKLGMRIFTRNLENVTHMFPDVAEALSTEVRAKELILDSEGIGFDPKTGKFYPFQETIKRKRKHGIDETITKIPLKCFVFDVLYLDGENLIEKPFSERRKILEKILSPSNKILILSPQIITGDPKKMREYHDEQIKKGLEGAMVKKINAPYDPGRRGFTWVKFKQEETKKGGGLADTVDCVVMGITRGKGKRATFGVGSFLVGVRKRQEFVTVTNIGTGLSDNQFRELNERTRKLKVKVKPKGYLVDKNQEPDIWVEPKIVVEIQADNITKSPIHTAGLALRFPRLVNFRDDKSVEQISTIKEVESLYQMQFAQEK